MNLQISDCASEGQGRGMTIWASGKHGLLIWILMSLLNTAASQLNGYLSLDCGATADSTDPVTGIEWVTDAPYISSGIISTVNTPTSLELNKQQLGTLRYFRPGRSKHCYTLPASKSSAYLLRAMFRHGNFQPEIGISFDVSIDSTIADTFTMPEANNSYYAEYMVAATSNHIYFCLLPKVGNAFISTLELRPLARSMYDVVYDGRYLATINRLNCGVLSTHPVVRYPDDIYDRLWFSPSDNPNVETAETVSDIKIGQSLFDVPPMAVMQSAWVSWLSLSWFTPISAYVFEKTNTFYINLFFAEVQAIRATDTRIIDITMGDVVNVNVTVPAYAFQLYGKDINITSDNDGAKFTLTANPDSTLGPVLNAAEIYASRIAVTSSTEEEDVNALEVLKLSLGLSSWTGDPCLPVAYDWLTCGSGPTPRITKIILSGYNLSSMIPTSIGKLTALTDLWLDSNNISGNIPDLSNLERLNTLHLQNNFLSGKIPSTLASLPFLTELLLSNNKLSGPIPAALANRHGLKLETSGNDNLCAPTENCAADDDGGGGGGGNGISGALIGGIVGGVIAGLAVICLCVWCYCRKHAKPTPTVLPTINGNFNQNGALNGSKASLNRSGAAAVNHAREFTLAEVQQATQDFLNKIGEGGFGPVYYGKLSDGTELAVKVNSETSEQGLTEFTNEVSLLSRVHHRNLVSLLGFCEEGGQQILIYEYMPNGTLRDHLYGRDMKGKLSWKERLDIALNAAKGLEYLHNDCVPKVIHRDVKTNNILLDGKFVAKVADFGISKLAPEDGQTSAMSTVVRGTAGYLDPEYYRHSKLTHKSDVYSFGVVLLEIMCGRPPNSPNQPDPKQYNLMDWARGQLRGSDLESIVDPAIRGTYNMEAMWKVAELAMGCVEPNGDSRPDMKQVVRGLTAASEFEMGGTQTSYSAGGNAMVGGYGTSASDYPSAFNTEGNQTQSSVASIPENPQVSREHSENPLFTPPRSFVRVPSDKYDSHPSWLAPKPR